ncbi:MAG TPA: recombinase family protein [Flavobacterium sp.]|jgi:DNA invertase Pin-like site-specific DNA recombinase|nr:recombinase family protein [Flavobacterium sp.]
MIYGYARVSTVGQDLTVQKKALKNSGVDAKSIYAEKYTGTTTDRPQFNALMAILKAGDTLTITKLDRLARNTREALDVIETLLDKDVTINVLNLGQIENTSIGRMIYTILLSVATLERDMIVERTQEGKAYAKKHKPNYREGRPKRKLTTHYLHAIELLKEHTYKEVASKTKISESTLHRIKKQFDDEQKK